MIAVYILLGVLAVLAVLALYVSTRSSEFRVSRSATMTAPAEAIFAQVNDFHRWEAWSPWAKMDPNAKNTFEGPASGRGAKFSWSGSSKTVGEGSMVIVESRPSQLIRIQLDFIRPFKGTNDVEFTFKPVGQRTDVTWSMSGKNNFMGKLIGLFMDCEKMVNEQYDKGLANIKEIVEREPALARS